MSSPPEPPAPPASSAIVVPKGVAGPKAVDVSKAAPKSAAGGRIGAADMRAAIERSGYLIEHRVAQAFEQAGFYVSANAPYPDPNTGISRELDISAISAHGLDRKYSEAVFPVVLCECENNPQPFVIFESPDLPHRWDTAMWKVSGSPCVVRANDGRGVPLADALKLDAFHHYWSTPTGTQYCTFQQKKAPPSDWIAFHSDEQHNTFVGLISALEADIDDHFDTYEPPPAPKRDTLNLQVYYLLLVLRGDLYLARPGKRGVVLSPRRHLSYLRSIWSRDRREEYQIDVVEESFITSYLSLVDKEMTALVKRLKARKNQLDDALDRLTTAARDAVAGGKNDIVWRALLTDAKLLGDSDAATAGGATKSEGDHKRTSVRAESG